MKRNCRKRIGKFLSYLIEGIAVLLFLIFIYEVIIIPIIEEPVLQFVIVAGVGLPVIFCMVGIIVNNWKNGRAWLRCGHFKK